MEENLFMGNQVSFIAPSGFEYTIREQNGDDDDILSNQVTAKTLRNVDLFIAGLVVKTDRTKSGRLTADDVHMLPTSDKYCILLQSRINSFGNILEFTHNWGEEYGEVTYEHDLEEFLLDYSNITLEEIVAKPNAIPAYPLGKESLDIPITTTSGKSLMFDLLNGVSELHLLNLKLSQNTKNQELIARNLRLCVDGTYEKITSFSLLSPKDMIEIRKEVKSVDPVFKGTIELTHPDYPQLRDVVNLMAISNFFYPGEA